MARLRGKTIKTYWGLQGVLVSHVDSMREVCKSAVERKSRGITGQSVFSHSLQAVWRPLQMDQWKGQNLGKR